MENKTEKKPLRPSDGNKQEGGGLEKPGRDSSVQEKFPQEEVFPTSQEQAVEQQPGRESRSAQENEPSASSAGTQAKQSAASHTIQRVRVLESILAEGMEDLYVNLPPETQQKFRRKGEETSQEVVTLFAKGKATLQKVYSLVLRWLKILPGVNHFFLEKEAKLKTDKIFKTFRT